MLEYALDHVGVAVESLEAARPIFEALAREKATDVLEVPEQGVTVAFVGRVELIEPRVADSPVGRFLERRGPGLHHIAYRVPDLVAALERARQEGFDPIDAEARPGAHGHMVAFLHPTTTGGVLVELVERRTEPTGSDAAPGQPRSP